MTGAVGGPASRITSEARGTWWVLAEYPDLADDWMRLQAQSDGTPFTHWHWISTWLEQLPAHIVPRVFRIEDAEGLLALAVAVAEYHLERPIRTVLDIGCGEGAWRARC